MYNKINILIVEDEKNICNFIKTILSVQDYRINIAETGADAMHIITGRWPDVILLDLGLPDMDGCEIIRSIREWSSMPVIVISARMEETDKVRALDLGADDYITKPFGPSELLARIRAALRHSSQKLSTGVARQYQLDGLVIDFDKRLVTLNGEELHMTGVEYKLLSLLASNAGRVVTYDSIKKQIWGPYSEDDNRILRVNMANIRRKLEENPAEPKYIFTEIGVGYRMAEDSN